MAAVGESNQFQKGDTPKFKQTSTVAEVQGNIPTAKLIPIHPSVIKLGKEKNGTTSATCTIYGKTTLSSLLREYIVDFDYKRCIFLQIVYALIFMQSDPPRDALHAEKIYFSHDCRYATVVIHKRESGSPSKANDAELLKELFRYIFNLHSSAAVPSDGNLALPDHEIALDIEKKIAKSSQQLVGLLKHPFFWSYEKKLQFLIDVYENIKKDSYLKNKFNSESVDWIEKIKQDQQKQKFNEYPTESKTPLDWIKALTFTVKEVEQLTRKKILAKTSAIYDVAPKKIKEAKPGEEEILIKKYDKSKVFDLLRFIRNHKIHFLRSDLKQYFKDDSRDYWLFFSVRFPDFFMYVYDFAKGNLFDGSCLQSEYFNSACPYSFLTDFKQPEKKAMTTEPA